MAIHAVTPYLETLVVFRHYNMVITNFDSQDFSRDFEGITLIVANNIVKTSTHIT